MMFSNGTNEFPNMAKVEGKSRFPPRFTCNIFMCKFSDVINV